MKGQPGGLGAVAGRISHPMTLKEYGEPIPPVLKKTP